MVKFTSWVWSLTLLFIDLIALLLITGSIHCFLKRFMYVMALWFLISASSFKKIISLYSVDRGDNISSTSVHLPKKIGWDIPDPTEKKMSTWKNPWHWNYVQSQNQNHVVIKKKRFTRSRTLDMLIGTKKLRLTTRKLNDFKYVILATAAGFGAN